jgi:Lrp/AsnC family leucine-responsive transcriptional regulator
VQRHAGHHESDADDLHRARDLARETPEVIECHRVTGDDCYVMTMHVRDVEHLEEIIDEFAAYGQTTTSIIQSSPVPRRAVSLVRCRMPAR